MGDKKSSNLSAVTDYVIKGNQICEGENTVYNKSNITNLGDETIKWLIDNRDVLQEMVTKYVEDDRQAELDGSNFFLVSEHGSIVVYSHPDSSELIIKFYNKLDELLSTGNNMSIMDRVKRLYPRKSKVPFYDFKSCTLYDAVLIEDYTDDASTCIELSCRDVVIELGKEMTWFTTTIDNMTIFETLYYRKEVGLMTNIIMIYNEVFANQIEYIP